MTAKSAWFSVRPALPADIPDLMRLKRLLAAAEDSLHAVRAGEAAWRRDGFGERPAFTAFVAEFGGAIIGMATCSHRAVTGWDSFEPWLTRLETMPADQVWAAANEVPPHWYGGDLGEMEALVEKLLARRARIRELVEAFARSDRNPFPNWGQATPSSSDPPWLRASFGATIEGRPN